METVFTIASKRELLDLFGDEERIDLARRAATSDDERNGQLAILYYHRGDTAASEAALSRIGDFAYRLSICKRIEVESSFTVQR